MVGGMARMTGPNRGASIAVARLNGDGTLDPFFGIGGIKEVTPAGASRIEDAGRLAIIEGQAIFVLGNYFESDSAYQPILVRFWP